jgi:O-succinylbenzoic acid--CoA ligase
VRLSILEAARELPDRIGIVAGGVEHSYGSLGGRVAALIGWWRERGLRGGSDERVALVAEPTMDTLLVLYSLIELGVTVVFIHPRLTPTEREWILADSRPDLVVANPSEVPPQTAATGDLDPAPAPAIDPERALAIIYTSGTTGRPKGAILSRRAFVAAADASARNLGWRDDDRWLLCMPAAHVGGLSIAIRTLLARRCLVLPRASSAPMRFDPELVARTIADSSVSLVSFVPTMLRKMMDRPGGWAPPPSLRAILLGGAAAPPSLLYEAADRLLPILTTYGLTEACSQVTSQAFGTVPSPDEGSGAPVHGVSVRIAEDEIQVRGPTLMSGYFPVGAHPSPVSADGWLQTGDLGRLDEQGRLHVQSRRRDLIVTGGENVYPAEVEGALEQMPGVRASCVFGVPDETWGAIVAAAVVADPQVDEAAIAGWLATRLAPHKLPRRIALVPQLPTNAAGKVVRAEVVELATPLLRDPRAERRAPPRR